MPNFDDSTPLPSRHSLLNGACSLALVIGAAFLPGSALAARGRRPENVADLDAERLPNRTPRGDEMWRIVSDRHWSRYQAGDAVLVDPGLGEIMDAIRAQWVAWTIEFWADLARN